MKLSDYLLIPALSSGVLHTLVTRSAAHAAYQQAQPMEPTKETDAGSVAHAILLEGNESCIVVVDAEDWRTKEARALRDDARVGGKIPLLPKQLDEIRRMVTVAQAHLEGSPIAQDFAGGVSEESIKWDDDGLICKARFDRVNYDTDLIVDYKTCGGAVNPTFWNRHVISMGYDIQAAFYMRGYRATTGREARFIWLAQETEPPYFCCLMDMAPDLRDYAESRVARGMDKWRQAIQTSKWPAYPNRVCSLEVPGWAQAQEEADALMDAHFSNEELSGGIPL